MDRRKFLTHGCGLGLASTTLSSSLLQLAMTRNLAADANGDYCAMVCILLAGGNDSYNMLVPHTLDQHNAYSSIRSDLALDRNSLLTLPGVASNGRSYGLHPGMQKVRDLYATDDLAFIANVGTLVEPFNANTFANDQARLPLGLFSHSDQISQWQTAIPDGRVAQGWGGRLADLPAFQGVNFANGLSMNISLSGSNVFQTGNLSNEYSISPQNDGAVGLFGYDEDSDYGQFKTSIIDALLGANQEGLLRQEYNKRLRGSLDNFRVFSEAIQTIQPLSTSFSDNNFSRSLRQIARTISARGALGASRQTFFITVGGWDHHDEVLDNQARMLPMISDGLGEFKDALVELGVFNDVTTFTISDFGRTLTSNGRGSDHGWGGHHMVMGGRVKGGQIYGDYPILSPNSMLDVGRGIYAPTTSVDEYFAELALWFGVAPSDLEVVLPRVRNFVDPLSSSPPLGFLL